MPQDQVQGGGTAGDGDAVSHADLLGELPFEAVQVGPHGRDPVFRKHLVDVLPFTTRHVRG